MSIACVMIGKYKTILHSSIYIHTLFLAYCDASTRQERPIVKNTQISVMASKVQWSQIAARVRPETQLGLTLFRKRHQNLSKQLLALQDLPTTIDFSAYAHLKNYHVVAAAQKTMASFTPDPYDLKQQLKVIDEAHARETKLAQQTQDSVKAQIKEMNVLLENIKNAKSLDEMTVS